MRTPHTTKRIIAGAAAVGALTLGVVACGSDEDPDDPGGELETPVDDGVEPVEPIDGEG